MATDSGDNEEIPLDLNLEGDPPLKTLGSGGEAPPGRPKSEDLPFKTVGSEGEVLPKRTLSEDLPLKTLGSGEPDRWRIGSRTAK